MNEIITKLSEREKQTVGECLRAAVIGTFFPDWEFQTLFGITREKVSAIAQRWPDIDNIDEVVSAAIVGSLGHLLGYPHGEEAQWSEFISVSADDVKQTLGKLIELGL